MKRTTTLVIGGGQAGLAMSHCLSARGIDHVVLERGAVAQRWRSDGWDSLRLLTPNWMTRLPGFRYGGPDPDGFMSAREVVALLEQYSHVSSAPVITDTLVSHVERRDDGFRVVSNQDEWRARSVVIATGYCDTPSVPAIAGRLPARIAQIAPRDYRHPGQLPDGGVLVVGASSTGVQLADEIQRSGRQVTLAVGRHIRLPRNYRGHDILWWLDRLGVLGQEVSSVHDIDTSRNQPSLQLVGRPDHASIDLGTLHARGVRLTGHLQAIDGERVRLADDLVATAAAADVKLVDVLSRVDAFIARTGIPAPAREPFTPTWPLADGAPESLDLDREGIASVVWATGYRRRYPWLRVPVLDNRGEIRHHEGITPEPGLYVLGLSFQRRRNSAFIDGVGHDAAFLARQIERSLAAPSARDMSHVHEV